ncbi:MarR family winged helix-turn-helix transcriptional regulator [Lysinibacillus irui]|uniref:MarR family winged helix-turn-helix transcriptional regulator n=1 Tax=Lysinibacillus irui TaxID=2998077 RepID=A0ABU5NHR2_9BACI|nr:MarR family winged helix-turn-helix transcriptional regulator [Lysinibacillus irui]MEA0552982.1 MarR family winged helix-turn-helix transcriptional regulator [Lysinibacillus irui]MEA0975562.1 MarR family winged helix-turn-helix transcriptional regulator [Lysinibacillus irui]MEA1041716.1 MarR family winged helix-turn-helix transcriptional regulator [Lysinibacillus irui]
MESNREIFHLLTRRFGLLDKNCCSVGNFEISTIQSHILYEIDKKHEPSMQQIADLLAIDITTFSRQIQSLVKMELVKKTPSQQDKRVFILTLTVQGKFVATSIDHSMNAYLEEVFSHMNDFEKETVIRSIKLLNEAMSKSSVCCKPLY